MSDNVNMLCNVSGNVSRTQPQGSITLGDRLRSDDHVLQKRPILDSRPTQNHKNRRALEASPSTLLASGGWGQRPHNSGFSPLLHDEFLGTSCLESFDFLTN